MKRALKEFCVYLWRRLSGDMRCESCDWDLIDWHTPCPRCRPDYFGH